ncbi:type IV toxin-antitoxin system AbiEi family antitoxin [Arthrobacter sp. Helios]|uniref:type IV toxin-antitoxin system AbiEi family antitoxin n=1 Tax=Arthrobacter sp. Helios TaxID=2828862 RepID=UPI0020534214|nr:type IV toxin-antitoxin system AbiEi family antitoxin [Arthrobacter sp. Helios]UPO78426.1 type IV toxin-antitoxin system AbiEi family antitoxin [Arthrobacter sp. Helios]
MSLSSPMPGAIPAVTSTGGAIFHPGGPFTEEELQGMCRDLLVTRVYGSTYLRWDVRPGPLARALAAHHHLPASLQGRYVFGRLSAAWIYGCAPPPRRLTLLADARRRSTSLPPFSGAVLHEVTLGPADRLELGGVPVTQPLRTALDVALHAPLAEAADVLVQMSREPGLNAPLHYVRTLLRSGHRVPGTRQALEAVELAEASAGETRGSGTEETGPEPDHSGSGPLTAPSESVPA